MNLQLPKANSTIATITMSIIRIYDQSDRVSRLFETHHRLIVLNLQSNQHETFHSFHLTFSQQFQQIGFYFQKENNNNNKQNQAKKKRKKQSFIRLNMYNIEKLDFHRTLGNLSRRQPRDSNSRCRHEQLFLNVAASAYYKPCNRLPRATRGFPRAR